MADIDSILAGVGGNTRADFSAIGDLPKAYWEGKDQRAKNDLRDAFKGGVPLTDDGQPDFGAMAKTLFQKGGLSEGTAAANLGLAQQNMKFGQGQSGAISRYEGGQAPQAPIVSPSVNRQVPIAGNGPVRAAPAGIAQPSQEQPTVMKIMAAQGIPNDQLGAASASVARQLGVDPTAPLDINDPQVRNVLAPAIAQIKKMGLGQVQPPQPGDNQPQQAPQVAPTQQVAQAPQQPPQMAPQGQPAPVTNALTTTQAPATPSRIDQGIAFYSGVMSDPRSPKQNVELAKSRLEALQKNSELTPDQKNYVQYKLEGGKGTMEDFLNRADENTTQRDILTKSTIPRLEKSQDKATSAIEDIDAIHRSRNELDQAGGVITGVWANDRLKLAKIGNSLGITDSDKITNTEAFSAAVGKRVAAMVKAFGSGTAISDGDRRFAEKMAGGGIELNETSMRRILDIGEQADRAIIGRHNEFADTAVKSNEGLKSARDTFIVKPPGQYKKPDQQQAAPSPGSAQAATMISSKADYDKLPKGAKFTGPDGKPWLKP